ncbi:ABC transporter permease [Kitasatospora sp. NPDC098652]|uniref:ABC transporter permease n=1 Tax=Kitasatospora sp. NPDC098652 TaxID=3364095 RepID=UPI003827D12C
MNTPLRSSTALHSSTPARSAAPVRRARFGDLLAAEWLKFWSLRSIPWVLAVGALVILAANLKSAQYTHDHYTPGDGAPATMKQEALNVSFITGSADVVMLLSGGLGAIVIAGEYATGLIRTTLAAVPDRRAVLLAKAGVLTAVLLGFGIGTAGLSFALTQAMLADQGIGQSITDPTALRYVAAAALFAPVCGLVGLCLGTLIRHSAGAAVGTIVLLFFLPSVVTERYRWSADLLHALPFSAWGRLARTTLAGMRPTDYPATVAGAWTTYAVWALASVLIAVAVIRRRDH